MSIQCDYCGKHVEALPIHTCKPEVTPEEALQAVSDINTFSDACVSPRSNNGMRTLLRYINQTAEEVR